MSEIESGVVGEFPYSIHLQDGGGHLCGYLGVPPGHPWHGVSYTDNDWNNAVSRIDVHGGVTFSKSGDGGYPHSFAFDVWWIGFDCAHSYDQSWGSSHGTYRDRNYVMREIEHMAEQAAAAQEGMRP